MSTTAELVADSEGTHTAPAYSQRHSRRANAEQHDS